MDTFWSFICWKYYGNNAINITIKKSFIYIRFSNDPRTCNLKLYLFPISNLMETSYTAKYFASIDIISRSTSTPNCWNTKLDRWWSTRIKSNWSKFIITKTTIVFLDCNEIINKDMNMKIKDVNHLREAMKKLKFY